VNIDLGLQGLALLIIPGLLFGLIAQLIFWKRTTRWLWLIGAVAWVVAGLFMSEVVFGSETTEENLQPLIDGLLWDEALLGGLVAGVAAVLVTWLVTRRVGADRRAVHSA
jgi:Na+/proline symporter